jgi:hypothetical protein
MSLNGKQFKWQAILEKCLFATALLFTPQPSKSKRKTEKEYQLSEKQKKNE